MLKDLRQVREVVHAPPPLKTTSDAGEDERRVVGKMSQATTFGSTWYGLENGGDLLPPYVKETHLHKIAAMKTAQRNGVVNASIDAAALLNLILHMSLTGSMDSPVMKPVGISRAARKRAVMAACNATPSARGAPNARANRALRH